MDTVVQCHKFCDVALLCYHISTTHADMYFAALRKKEAKNVFMKHWSLIASRHKILYRVDVGHLVGTKQMWFEACNFY